MKSRLFVPRYLKRRSLSAIKRTQARYQLAIRLLRGQAPVRKRTLHMGLKERIKAVERGTDAGQGA